MGDYPPRLEFEHIHRAGAGGWHLGLPPGFPGGPGRDHSFLVLLLCYTVPSDANTLPPRPPVGILLVTTELFITSKRNQPATT